MAKTVLALGLDPIHADFSNFPQLTPELLRGFIEQQLELVRGAGYNVVPCLIDSGATAEATVEAHLRQHIDCVMIGAGLRDPQHLLLMERLLNLVHRHCPDAAICFNTSPTDSLEAVRRWV